MCTEAHSSPGSWPLSSAQRPTPCKIQANSVGATDLPPPQATPSPQLTDSREHESFHGPILQFLLLQLAHTSTSLSPGELQTSQLYHPITFQRFKTGFRAVLPQVKEFQLVDNL